MPFTVLTDDNVRDLLDGLTKDDANELQHNLADALHSYSTGDTNSPCCSSYQPQRTIIKKNGITSLFMPATTGDSVGIKVVSLETPADDRSPKKKSSISSTSTRSATASNGSSLSNTMSNMTLSPASTMGSEISNTSSKSTTGSNFQPPPSIASNQSTTPRGTVTLMDRLGKPMGILNAEELTAFRTALASTILFQKREHVHTITVFGAGKQAYWHIRLALLFKGDQIKHVYIINRNMDRAVRLMSQFQPRSDGQPLPWRSDIKFSALSPEFGEYGRLLKEQVRKADAIFCCTPSTEPLFPPEFLTSHNGQRKGRYVAAIGSYAPHMLELHPDILRHATDTMPEDHSHHIHGHGVPHFKAAKKQGVVIVDTLEGSMKEAKLRPENLVELGELMMVKKSVMRELELGTGPGEKGLKDWLCGGTVVFKGVGLGLMDLTVGGDLVRLARERGVGVTIQDF